MFLSMVDLLGVIAPVVLGDDLITGLVQQVLYDKRFYQTQDRTFTKCCRDSKGGV